MDLSKLSMQELKALAYDQISTIEVSRQNLGAIEAMIQVRKTEAAALPATEAPGGTEAESAGE